MSDNENMLARMLYGQGLSMDTPQMNVLANMLGTGLAPYGFRHEESVTAPFSAKGRGYYGPLPHAEGGVSTEIPAHDDAAQGFPLMVPGLSAQELSGLLSGAQPSEDVYRKAAAFAAVRRAAGLSPFAQPNDLRMPRP